MYVFGLPKYDVQYLESHHFSVYLPINKFGSHERPGPSEFSEGYLICVLSVYERTAHSRACVRVCVCVRSMKKILSFTWANLTFSVAAHVGTHRTLAPLRPRLLLKAAWLHVPWLATGSVDHIVSRMRNAIFICSTKCVDAAIKWHSTHTHTHPVIRSILAGYHRITSEQATFITSH